MGRGLTEVEQALEIARKTRQECLFGKNPLEKNLHGLYTIAQILGRGDDMEWASSELNGYAGGHPPYRAKVHRAFRVGESGKVVAALSYGDVSVAACDLSVTQIEESLDPKSGNGPSYALAGDEIDAMDDVQKRAVKGVPLITWQFVNSDLLLVLSAARLELVRRTNDIISEITYGKIPEGIFKKFQDKVNTLLANSNPAAVSQLNIAYENLVQFEDPEKSSHVAFSCRRLIKAVADELFPARDRAYSTRDGKSLEVGKERYLNRLEAWIDSLGSDRYGYLAKKVDLLRDMYGNMPQSINKGTHASITGADAEMLVMYSYLILGEFVLARQDLDKAQKLEKSAKRGSGAKARPARKGPGRAGSKGAGTVP